MSTEAAPRSRLAALGSSLESARFWGVIGSVWFALAWGSVAAGTGLNTFLQFAALGGFFVSGAIAALDGGGAT